MKNGEKKNETRKSFQCEWETWDQRIRHVRHGEHAVKQLDITDITLRNRDFGNACIGEMRCSWGDVYGRQQGL